jgi:hypothetical protein
MASAQALSLLGVIAFPAHDIIQNGRGLVSQADIFFLAFYPLFAIGVLFLPMAELAMRERIKVLLDICIVVITAAMLVWAFLIGPVFQAGMGNAGNAMTISISYPILDLVLLFALLEILYRGMSSNQKIPMAILACGVTANIIGDLIYTYQSLHGTLVINGWAGIFFYIILCSYRAGGHLACRGISPPWRCRRSPAVSILLDKAYPLCVDMYGLSSADLGACGC